jgi:hypothetical protein
MPMPVQPARIFTVLDSEEISGRAVRSAGNPAMVAAVSSAPGNRMAGVGAFADGDYRTFFIIEAETNGLFTEAVLVTVASAQKWQREITARGLFCDA